MGAIFNNLERRLTHRSVPVTVQDRQILTMENEWEGLSNGYYGTIF